MPLKPIAGGVLALALALWAGAVRAEDEAAPDRRPVTAVADQTMTVATPAGEGALRLYVSRDWSLPLPEIVRAVIVIHGRLRNADTYYRSAQAALEASGETAGTLLIVPQFLAARDIDAHRLPAATLRWSLTGWEGGADAEGPAPLSSFDALDAILARLADSRIFPDLAHIVVAGHSGGAQVVQRYAVLARKIGAVAPRYVVANPSSYAYFSAERPAPVDAAACPLFDRWKYGMEGLPRYAGDATAASLEQAYVARDVIYLLGTADTDPRHPALDKSCMAEAQGAYRLARGLSYVAYLRRRHPALAQRLWTVPGIGHDGDKILTSACGLAALFDTPGCAAP
ncbi:MAG: hypothetical protein ACLQJR_25545 [Stellaceae bacterium]